MIVIHCLEGAVKIRRKGFISSTWEIIKNILISLIWISIGALVIFVIPIAISLMIDKIFGADITLFTCIGGLVAFIIFVLCLKKVNGDISENKAVPLQVTTEDGFNFTFLQINSGSVIRTTAKDIIVKYYTYTNDFKIIINNANIQGNNKVYKVKIQAIHGYDKYTKYVRVFEKLNVKTLVINNRPEHR